MGIDLTFIHNQFPAFNEPSLNGSIFLENAGGSHMCKQVVDRLTHYHQSCRVQPYHPSPVAQKAGALMDEAYTSLAPWLNTKPENIYFGPSTSQNTYVLAQAMSEWLQPNDEVIITSQDHEANIGSWRRMEKRGIKVIEWPIDSTTGSLDIGKLKQLITDKTKLLTFPHCSNILGEINPVAEICALAKAQGVKTIVDGVSYAGHGLPDIKSLGCDIYLFSLYKVYGPHLGVMVIDDAMSAHLTNQSHFFNHADRSKRLLPAGPDHAQIAAVKGVSDYFDALYQHHFLGKDSDKPQVIRELLHSVEIEVLQPLLTYFSDHKDFRLVGPDDAQKRAPTVSVIPKNQTPWEFAKRLGDEGIYCAAGHFYSYRLLQAMGIDPEQGVLRFSMVHYNSKSDIDRLIDTLKSPDITPSQI